MTNNFAIIGAAGYIAPRHMNAIKATGNKLVAAVDRHDSVGIIDRYSLETRFFTEIERFDRYVFKLSREDSCNHIKYISICTPNYLHDAHVRLALRNGCHAICEKPVVINPWNIDMLEELEQDYDSRAYTVLQLRLHPSIQKLYNDVRSHPAQEKADIRLSYVTRRGPWYHISWKGDDSKSGGIVMNIGVHFFDMLLWIFGAVERNDVYLCDHLRASGYLELERARVRWFMSIDSKDLPSEAIQNKLPAYRSLTIDDEEVNFSQGFDDLHTSVYRDILAGGGFSLNEARGAIKLVHAIRTAKLCHERKYIHPQLQ